MLDKKLINELEREKMQVEINKEVCKKWIEIDEISKELCHDNCRWYHGAWCLLKCLDLVAGAVLFYKFYHKEIGSLSVERVAVVGTAGISTPVLLSELQPKAKLDVIDICPTPLKACEMYAKEHGLIWNFRQQDMIKGFEPIQAYDLVVNDAFITLFRDLDKAIVLQNIAMLLNPKGYYITTLRKGAYEGEVYRAEQKVQDTFVDNALIRSQEMAFEDKEFIRKKAKDYTATKINYPMDSMENVKKLFNSNGFQVVSIDETEIIGESGNTIYFQVVAQREEEVLL